MLRELVGQLPAELVPPRLADGPVQGARVGPAAAHPPPRTALFQADDRGARRHGARPCVAIGRDPPCHPLAKPPQPFHGAAVVRAAVRVRQVVRGPIPDLPPPHGAARPGRIHAAGHGPLQPRQRPPLGGGQRVRRPPAAVGHRGVRLGPDRHAERAARRRPALPHQVPHDRHVPAPIVVGHGGRHDPVLRVAGLAREPDRAEP